MIDSSEVYDKDFLGWVSPAPQPLPKYLLPFVWASHPRPPPTTIQRNLFSAAVLNLAHLINTDNLINERNFGAVGAKLLAWKTLHIINEFQNFQLVSELDKNLIFL